MQIRNAFIILMRIQPHFPVISKLAQIIERKVEKVKEEEKNQRQDLFVLASSYIAILKSKAKELMKESDFHQVADRVQKEPAEIKAMNGDSKPGESFELLFSQIQSHYNKILLKIITDIKRETKERERSEKKVIKTVDREIKHETPAREHKEARESREPTAPREKSTKEIKKEEKQREKERDREDSEVRKKDKEKRREKRAPSPDHYEHERDRERELSSVSNSSNGSIHQRQEPVPEHDRGERFDFSWYSKIF